MGMQRKQHSAEFKREAVRLWQEEGRNASQLARDLDINRNLLAKWKAQLDTAQQAQAAGRSDYQAFPGQGNPADAELARLRRENEVLRQERDILKKAVSIFSQPGR